MAQDADPGHMMAVRENAAAPAEVLEVELPETSAGVEPPASAARREPVR